MQKFYLCRRALWLPVFLFLITNSLFAQLAAWELSSETGSQTSSTANIVGTNITAGVLTRGAGVTASAAGGSISSSGWFSSSTPTTLSDAIVNNDYYEFTLPINSGFQANISNIGVVLRGSNTGPNTVALRSSIDSYSTTLGTATVTASSVLNNFSLSFNSISGTITFRLYGYGSAIGSTSTAGSGGTLRIGSSTVTTDNDLIITGTTAPITSTTPTLSINDVTLAEGNSGTTDFTFTATLSAPAPAGGVTFDIATANGTANSPSDYEAKTLSGQTIAEGATSYTFTVAVHGDTEGEPNESFFVNITNIIGANAGDAQGLGTITNDDMVLPTININDVTVAEGNSGITNFNFTATLSAPAPAGGVTFNIGTANGTATSPSDYEAKTLTSQTIAEGATTYSFTVAVNGDTEGEPNESFFVNITNIVGATAGDAQGLGTITNDDISITKIHTIQGSGATTAVANTTQTVQGVVTRVFSGLGGFYMQEEDADADTDPATSEGIFVTATSPSVSVGDIVTVTGTINELTTNSTGFPTSSLTRFSTTSSIAVNSSGNSLPTIPTISLPIANISDWERYEGMLVNVQATVGDLVVTSNFQLGRFGQIVLSANDPSSNQTGTDARIDQFTQFNTPSVTGNATYQASVDKRIIYLDDANSTQNVDPILFARGGNPLSASNTLRGGDATNLITGILDQRFEGYRVQTTQPVNFTAANPRPANNPNVGAATLKVGNMNVLNYFLTLGSAGRGASNSTEFTRQKNKILSAIVGSGLDMVSLNEIEQLSGDKGVAALTDLVAGLNAQVGAGTWAFVTPAGSTGTDQITNAFIYKPAKLMPKGSTKTLNSGEFSAVGRAAIAQTFEQVGNLADFTAVSVHFKSKGSLSSGADNIDIGDGQGNNNGQRTRQAQQLRDWLIDPMTGITDPDIIILGDINAYAKEDPITTLETAGYATLIPIDRYSYQFDGNFGALDHALGTASLASQTTGALKWNINADEPIVLDYNTEFKSSGHQTSLYAPDAYRSSDHDPVVVGLNLLCDDLTTNTTTATACDTYTWAVNNQNYTASGTYESTVDCDKQVLVLTINNSTSSSTTVTACDSYTWAANGMTYTTSGEYVATLTNATGCTLTETLILTINNSTSSSTTVTACDSYTWAANGMTYTTSGEYVATSTNATGCTLTETLILTINNSTSSSTTITACDSYTWAANGMTYTTSGEYVATSTNATGCTLTETLILTINNSTSSSTTVTACDSYTWAANSMTYTASGTYEYVSTNATGCTNTETLVLTINNSTSSSTTVTACDSYTWAANGMTYTQSGEYVATSTNATGCTLTETLILTINNSTSSSTTVTACDSYTWAANGMTYTTSGEYVATSTNATGCTLTETLILTINSVSLSFGSKTEACNSQAGTVQIIASGGTGNLSITSSGGIVNNAILTAPAGTYTVTVTDAQGCSKTASVTITECVNNLFSIRCHSSLLLDNGTRIPAPGPDYGGLYITLIKSWDRVNGEILGVYPIGADAKAFISMIPYGNYTLIFTTNAAGARTPNAPVGYVFEGERVIIDPTKVGGAIAPDIADGIFYLNNDIPANGRLQAIAEPIVNIEFTFKPGAPLPVRLVSFNGKSTAKGNELSWKTSAEVNFSHFEIERSTDARSFQKIGIIKGNKAENYEFVDNQTFNIHHSSLYYRLHMVDLDGKAEYSKNIFLKNEAASESMTVQNPAQNGELMVFTTLAQPKYILSTHTGQILPHTVSLLADGQYKITVKNAATGQYFLQLKTATKAITKKVIMQ